MMRRRLVILSTVAALTISVMSVRLFLQVTSRTRLDLPRIMPAGALAYVEFQDLGQLIGRWRSSAAHKRYQDSVNWKEFQNSRLYLRFLQRLEPLEVALGFELTEQRLAAMVGSRSGLGVYDIGKLEILFVTSLSQQEAFASTLFKQRQAFRERSSDGFVYYTREGTSPDTQEKAVACFSFSQGMMLVASSENLLRRGLSNIVNPGDDRLSLTIDGLTDQLGDFQPHDLTLWLDQKRLNADRYFKNYWIHENLSALGGIESTVIDLELTDREFRERRWFALDETARAADPTMIEVGEMLRMAPPDTTLITVEATVDLESLSRRLVDVILGSPPSRDVLHASLDLGPTDQDGLSRRPTRGDWSFSPLDDRFNREIDDPTSFSGVGLGVSRGPIEDADANRQFISGVSRRLAGARPGPWLTVGRAQLGANRLFVEFNRALVIRLADPGALDREGLETLLREEFHTRHVIQGIPASDRWEDADEIRSLSQSIVRRGGATALVGDFFIVANRTPFCTEIVQAYKHSPQPSIGRRPMLQGYAQIRIRPGIDVYRHVMGMLAAPVTSDISGEPVDLFRDNIAGLIDVVPTSRSVTIERVKTASFLRELTTYEFEEPSPRDRRRIRR